MKRSITISLFLFTSLISFCQDHKIDSLFKKFQRASFYEHVLPSKLRLEDQQKKIIPTLIKLLDDTGFVKLENTADLIYPGATQFYGHGHYVPYDMDWISVRAGWLLEELSFQDFGYKTSGVDDAYLFKLMKEKYSEYLKKGTYELEWKQKSTKEKLIAFRKILAKKAKDWWQANENTWTRIAAIKEALQSNDEHRLGEVLQFLRYGETKCDSLNTALYLKEIKPLVVALKNTTYKSVKEQVDLLLNEDLGYWTNKMKELEKKGW